MCGICGEVTFGEGQEADPGRVRDMAALLAHRGPDGEGHWSENGVALGHRRLAVIDLSESAAQPMASPDGRYVIAFNGEIYNFRELRAEMEREGETFTTRSDTEVLLRAFTLWGHAALKRLNGMWAFALWDRQHHRLTLCRDRLGVKPLYWARAGGGVVFASEIPPLLLHPEVSREVNPKALAEQVACRYVLAPRTLLSSVQKLPPGHIMEVTRAGTTVSPYWTVPIGERVRRFGEEPALERFGNLLETSVKRRLVADVPVGILLSGGVDSSALVAALHRAGHPPMSTFTVAFEGEGKCDERWWASQVAGRFRTDHHEMTISPEVFAASLGTVLSHLDDPVADMAVLPLYHVCGLAKEHVKVLLSGQGADEIMGGYHMERILRQIRTIVLLRHFPGARQLAAFIARRDPKRAYLADWDKICDAVPGLLPGRIRYDLTRPLMPEVMGSLLKEPMAPPYDRTLDAFYTEVPSHRGPLDAILGTLCKGWLPDNLLLHSDRMSMAHGMELREPYLDHELVRYCFRMPQRLKVKGGVTKYLLKRYAEKAGVPRAVAHRRKRGFPVPWGQWIRGPLRDFVRETFEDAAWMGDYFKKDGVDRVLREHQEGQEHDLLLWNLVVLAKWGQRMVSR